MVDIFHKVTQLEDVIVNFAEIYWIMDKFEAKIRRFIEERGLLTAETRVLVGLSGGADSVALASVLVGLGYECVLTHCNFGLRGDESLRDQRCAQRVADRLGRRLIVKVFDVDERRRCTGESVEMACRELRYGWWRELCMELGARCVAVGHHREDNAETLLLNMMRGCGLTGMKGMVPKSDMVIRPFLGVSRSEIESYCARQGLEWITDSSNLSDEYGRNKLRLKVFPLLEELFPGAMDGIVRSMDCLADNFTLYTELVDEKRARYVDERNAVDLERLVECERNARVVLFEMLHKEGFNMSQVTDILKSSGESGRVFNSRTGVTRLLDRGWLLEVRPAEEIPAVTAREPSEFDCIEVVECLAEEFLPSASAASFDAKILEHGSIWTLRQWRKGDRIRPFGMRGSKKVSDILSDMKMPLNEKSRVMVLECDGEIVWIPGIRASDRHKVTPATKRVITLIWRGVDRMPRPLRETPLCRR